MSQRFHVHCGSEIKHVIFAFRKYVVMERSAWKKMPIVMGVVAFGRFASLRKYGPFGEVVIVFNNVRKVRVPFAALIL